MRDNANKQKRKAYYRKCAAQAKRSRADGGESSGRQPVTPRHLQPGMTGYLVTCNQHERLATMEIFRLLNDALQRVTGSDAPASEPTKPEEKPAADGEEPTKVIDQSTTTTPSAAPSSLGDEAKRSEEDDNDDDDDILKQLRVENAADTTDSNGANARRHSFYTTRSGVSNCLFIVHYAEAASPNALVHSLFEHALEKRVVESRHVLRVLPVAATCHASAPELERCIRAVWSAFLEQVKSTNGEPSSTEADEKPDVTTAETKDEPVQPVNGSDSVHSICPTVPLPQALPDTLAVDGPKTYLVAFKARNYDRLSRDTAIETVVSTVRTIDPSWRISPSNPVVTIFINVLRNVACVSLLEQYDRFRKYNLAELVLPASSVSAAEGTVPKQVEVCNVAE